MDKLVPVLIVVGLLSATIAHRLRARRDARQRADQAAADEFRNDHLERVRSTL